MSERQRQMIEAFAKYEQKSRAELDKHNIIGVPLGTRLKRIVRTSNGWMLWVSTADFRIGTYYRLFDDGMVVNATEREDEGTEAFVVRPSDETIRKGE